MIENPANIVLVCDKCADKLFPNKGRFNVEIGDFAKLTFTDGKRNEYMWVKVIKADKEKDKYTGELDSESIYFDIKMGEMVEFNKADILEVLVPKM